MTGDDSLASDSIASDYRFVLEHDTSMLEMALAAVSFEDCSLDDAVPLDRISVAYDCWLEALEALHPGHRFRGFGLSDAELSDNGLLERLLLTVLFDGGSCRFIRSVVAFLLFGLVVLDGFHPPPVCELQFVHELESVLYRCHSFFPFTSPSRTRISKAV